VFDTNEADVLVTYALAESIETRLLSFETNFAFTVLADELEGLINGSPTPPKEIVKGILAV
jgi:hypothetical protein